MVLRRATAVLGVIGAAGAACVPPGNSTPSDAGAPVATAGHASPAALAQAANVLSVPFEDNFERPGMAVTNGKSPVMQASSASGDGGAAALLGSSARPDASSVVLRLPDGGRLVVGGDAAGAPPVQDLPPGSPEPASDLGTNWHQVQTNAWHIENGRLCVQNAHNHGVWLTKTLPVNARIEFDAVAESADGDLKAEIWGDGQSAATGISYTNATSYLTILGGWHNKYHVLARLNEHGTDRKEINVDATNDDPRAHPVVPGQIYHFKIERADGKTVKWSVNGLDMLSWTDDAPLAGPGHDHFGFNNWEVKVCFDNVKVTPISSL